MSSRCGACGCARHETLYVARGYDYLRCAACGSGRLAEPPEDPSSLYTEAYFDGGARGGYRGYDKDARLHTWTAERRLDRVARWVPSNTVRLIDVGCASGYVLAAARRRGWEVVGVEVSAAARARANRRGLTVEPSTSAAIPHLTGPATAVTFFQVLEHLPDPSGALAETVRSALPGAAFCIETWDLGSWTARIFGSRWQQANPPSVLHLFTRRGLNTMAERAGLRVLRIRVTPKPVSVALVVEVAGDSWPAARGGLNLAFRRTHLERLPIPYFLDDLITMTAVKPRARR